MAKNSEKTTSRQEILDAARDIFHRKGLSGARMQEIADAVNINKAMLHYYFKTKEQLFEAVFQEAFMKIVPQILFLLSQEGPIKEKIERFVEGYITLLQANPHMPAFILNELNQNPDRLLHIMKGTANPGMEKFLQQIEREIPAQKIKPEQLMVNLISMCVFPFVGKPLIMGMLKMDDQSFNEFIEQRKKEIPQFIFSSLQI